MCKVVQPAALIIWKDYRMLIKFCWTVLALIHVVPALALFKPALLTTLYGAQAGSVTYTLLHHRAALFTGVFIACVYAVVQPGSRQLSAAVVAVSMVSFLVLYVLSGQPDSLRLVAIVDLMGLPFLAIVAWQAFQAARVGK